MVMIQRFQDLLAVLCRLGQGRRLRFLVRLLSVVEERPRKQADLGLEEPADEADKDENSQHDKSNVDSRGWHSKSVKFS